MFQNKDMQSFKAFQFLCQEVHVDEIKTSKIAITCQNFIHGSLILNV